MDIKEMIKREIRTYERDRDTAAKEATKQDTMRSCYYEFVGVLENILNEMEKDGKNG